MHCIRYVKSACINDACAKSALHAFNYLSANSALCKINVQNQLAKNINFNLCKILYVPNQLMENQLCAKSAQKKK